MALAAGPVVFASSPSEGSKLETLESAAVYLTWVFDESITSPQKKPEMCGMNHEQAEQMLQSLKSQIDDQLKLKQKEWLKLSIGKRLGLAKGYQKSCHSSCVCGIWSSFFESLENLGKISVKEKLIYQDIAKQAQSLTAQDRQTCVRKNKWFCRSSLRRALEK